jgi:hypothetical protein
MGPRKGLASPFPFLASFVWTKVSLALGRGMEEVNSRKRDESVPLEFSRRQRPFVCFVLFWQRRSK